MRLRPHKFENNLDEELDPLTIGIKVKLFQLLERYACLEKALNIKIPEPKSFNGAQSSNEQYVLWDIEK